MISDKTIHKAFCTHTTLSKKSIREICNLYFLLYIGFNPPAPLDIFCDKSAAHIGLASQFHEFHFVTFWNTLEYSRIESNNNDLEYSILLYI